MQETIHATDLVVEMPQSPLVSIPVEDAEYIYELFRNVDVADAHFHSCQSANFRSHIKTVYQAPKVKEAFLNLKQKIEKAREV